MPPKAKICRVCKEPQPLDRFGVNKNEPDGKNATCKVCRKAENRVPTETDAFRLPRFDPKRPSDWMIKVNVALIKAIAADPGNPTLQNAGRVIARACTSARGYIVSGQLEEEVAGLREQVKAMLDARRHHGQGFLTAADIRAEAADVAGKTAH